MKIRIGTRKSNLAMAQTYLVRDAILAVEPAAQIELVALSTKGDKILDKPLLSFGGKGVFVEEFESKIKNGEIDIAVHSAKDMPMELLDGLTILAVLKREDPRDVFVTRKGTSWDRDRHFVIGTSSLRRKMQIARFGDVECRELRGNVNTRLRKLEEGQYDGIILAMAGLKRLGLDKDPGFSLTPFSCEEFIPAGGQGIIAIEGRKSSELNGLFQKLEDKSARYELLFERKVLQCLNAGCHEPIGVFSKVEGDEITGYLMKENKIQKVKGPKDSYEDLAQTLSKKGTV
jgi:hydroxymethylbilane synthase